MLGVKKRQVSQPGGVPKRGPQAGTEDAMDSSTLSEAVTIPVQQQRRVQQCSWGQAHTSEADAEAAEDREAERLISNGKGKQQGRRQQQDKHHQWRSKRRQKLARVVQPCSHPCWRRRIRRQLSFRRPWGKDRAAARGTCSEATVCVGHPRCLARCSNRSWHGHSGSMAAKLPGEHCRQEGSLDGSSSTQPRCGNASMLG